MVIVMILGDSVQVLKFEEKSLMAVGTILYIRKDSFCVLNLWWGQPVRYRTAWDCLCLEIYNSSIRLTIKINRGVKSGVKINNVVSHYFFVIVISSTNLLTSH